MADIMEYKCPACGGAMEFNSAAQKMKCPYCDTEMEVEAFQKLMNSEAAETAEAGEASDREAKGDGQWQQGETEHMRVYLCKSCGGEIVADETIGAASCPFCGNQVVMKGQFSGDRRPDYIIPFKLDKKAAKEAYHRHLKGKYFMPSIFKQENHIEEIKGVYVPFWVFDAKTNASATFTGERCRIWTEGSMEYTEHEVYEMNRSGEMDFSHVPVDGSKKMDDVLMESIEPFNFSDAVDFQTAYLAGYLAERYDVDVDSCLGRAKERMKDSAIRSLSGTVQGYQSVRTKESSVQVDCENYSYVLYPVWILNTSWRKKKYTFAMNGQTGRMVGDLPFDKEQFRNYVLTRGLAIGAVLYALLYVLMSW